MLCCYNSGAVNVFVPKSVGGFIFKQFLSVYY